MSIRGLLLMPDPLLSDTQYHRFHHRDIPGLATEDLQHELWALCPRLWHLPRDHWVHVRVSKLRVELARRRRPAW